MRRVDLFKGLTRVGFACLDRGASAHDQCTLCFFFGYPRLLNLLERDEGSFLLARLSLFVVTHTAVDRCIGGTKFTQQWLLLVT